MKSTGWSPAWSPDGKTIAYVDDEAGDDDEIYTVTADGKNVTQLTDNDGIDDDVADLVARLLADRLRERPRRRRRHLRDEEPTALASTPS